MAKPWGNGQHISSAAENQATVSEFLTNREILSDFKGNGGTLGDYTYALDNDTGKPGVPVTCISISSAVTPYFKQGYNYPGAIITRAEIYLKASQTGGTNQLATKAWITTEAIAGISLSGSYSDNQCVKWNDVVYEEPADYLTFTCTQAGGISMSNYGSNVPNIEYSKNNGDWTTWNYSNIPLSAGDVVKMRGVNSNGVNSSDTDYSQFIMTGKIAASGNIMSLIDGTGDTTVIPDGNYCFYSLFSFCSALTAAPELPATTLKPYCYNYMFYGCNNLTTAPELPATALASNCYAHMFYGCGGITAAPELPATTLANWCYDTMFYGCTGLTSAPELPATTLVNGCYHYMFYNCANLSSVTCLATSGINQNYSTENWLYGVAATGTFTKASSATWPSGVNGIPTGWTVQNALDYLTFTCTEAGGISLTNYGSNTPNIEYSKNDGTWTTWNYSNISLAAGDVVKMKGVNNNGISSSYSKYSQFVMTGKIASGGNIMSLIDGQQDGTKTIPGSSYCFYRMFYGCTGLTSAPELPATDLVYNCYCGMFQGCNSLTSAPELPAMSLASYCYGCMFQGCNSLTSAPELPATTTTSYCYNNMFYGCTSLTSAPELPATDLETSCYDCMFYGCTGLTSAPELPATSLAIMCYYNMFYGCTSLTSAPELPATDLERGCYSYMFKNCTALTSAPELPATDLVYNCYCGMFEGCTSLSSIKCLATSGINQNGSTAYWMYKTASSGTFTKASSATWPTSTSGIKSGWTVVNV